MHICDICDICLTGHEIMNYSFGLMYLLTHAGATQIGDDLGAVCDYNRTGTVMM